MSGTGRGPAHSPSGSDRRRPWSGDGTLHLEGDDVVFGDARLGQHRVGVGPVTGRWAEGGDAAVDLGRGADQREGGAVVVLHPLQIAVVERLLVLEHRPRRLGGRPWPFLPAEDLPPLLQGVGGEDLVEDLDAAPRCSWSAAFR